MDDYSTLHVFFVIDTSGSMRGEKIAGVNSGLQMLEAVARSSERIQATCEIGVVRFSNDAELLTPVCPADEFTAPVVSADGSTRLSTALRLVDSEIDRTWRPRSGDFPGDWQPLVFLLTDGMPDRGDPWREARARLFSRAHGIPSLLVVVGMGDHDTMDQEVLEELAPESWFTFNQFDERRMAALFRWIGNSMAQASMAVSQMSGTPDSLLAPPPEQLFDEQATGSDDDETDPDEGDSDSDDDSDPNVTGTSTR